MTTPDDHLVVLFGATGDLAKRKLLPGLFRLAQAGLLPPRYRIVGTALDDLDDHAFRELARTAVDEFGGGSRDPAAWERFARNLLYADARDRTALTAAAGTAELELGGSPRRLHYLSVPPIAFGEAVETLVEAGLVPRSRVVVEKPFGTDLESARALNASCTARSTSRRSSGSTTSSARRPSRTSSRCGSRTASSRRSGTAHHVDHVQIDVPETLSIGSRGYFYEGTGAFRDMLVTHLLQVLGFVAMEPPTSFEAKALVDETVKVFEAMTPLRPEDVVRGQYRGYRDTPGVSPDSDTETFVAARVQHRQLALGGRPVLPPHRQAPRGGTARRHDHLSRPAPADVRQRRPARPEPARLRAHRARRHLLELPRQGPRPGDAARAGPLLLPLRGCVLRRRASSRPTSG